MNVMKDDRTIFEEKFANIIQIFLFKKRRIRIRYTYSGSDWFRIYKTVWKDRFMARIG
jgi:hypothetical protein